MDGCLLFVPICPRGILPASRFTARKAARSWKLKFWRFRKETKADAKVRSSFKSESALGSGAGDPLSDLTCEGHRRQIVDFVQAVRDDRPPMVDGHEGRRSVALIEAIYKSASTGRGVRL